MSPADRVEESLLSTGAWTPLAPSVPRAEQNRKASEKMWCREKKYRNGNRPSRPEFAPERRKGVFQWCGSGCSAADAWSAPNRKQRSWYVRFPQSSGWKASRPDERSPSPALCLIQSPPAWYGKWPFQDWAFCFCAANSPGNRPACTPYKNMEALRAFRSSKSAQCSDALSSREVSPHGETCQDNPLLWINFFRPP